MTEPLLAGWESFYVIVGSSAAALTGLQFVVIVLAADRAIGTSETTTSFATPTIVHFGTVLLMSAILSAPWHGVGWPLALLALAGVGGCVYTARVIRVSRRQQHYTLELEDVICHWCLPMTAYGALALCGFFVGHAGGALFAVAGAALLLLFTAIHNAWDSATFIAGRQPRQD
jgi:hypothetical protein